MTKNKLDRARLLRQYENGLNAVKNTIEQCDPNTMSTEEISAALEDLPDMVKAIKKFWDEKLKEEDL